jgi:hypothetical protein
MSLFALISSFLLVVLVYNHPFYKDPIEIKPVKKWDEEFEVVDLTQVSEEVLTNTIDNSSLNDEIQIIK